MSNKIRVMIVEDHPLFGEGLRRIIESEPDLELVAEVRDGRDAVKQALELRPLVILMDVNLPSMNGLQATREIKAELDETAVIVLTAYHDDEQLFHALRAGATAYFPKDVTSSELLKAIRQVAKGNYVIGETVMGKPQVASWMLKRFEELAVFGESPDEMFVPLSPREMEILQYITRGSSNKEIARALSISRQTVKNHMSAILRKLAVNDRTQAAVLALRRGWIRLEDTAKQGPAS
jgi:DNA-binding NarL/FixJ family response regulator